MALTLSRPAKGKKKKNDLRHMPVKQSINLAEVEVNRIEYKKAIPLILVIVVLAVLFSKFLVIDRMVAMSRATGEVAALNSQVQSANELIASYGEIEDTYAHYTYSGMTEDELQRVDRTQVMDLVENFFLTGGVARSWSVSGNVLTVEMSGSSLEELNQLAQQVEQDPTVDRCTITTANMSDRLETSTDVRAMFIVYLQQPVEEGEQE